MIWAGRFIVAVVLIGAGILKAADPVPVLSLGWFSAWGASWILVAVLPWLEIGCGLLLLSDLPVRWTAVPATMLCSGFLVVTLTRLLVEGVSQECGCFGVLSAPLDQWHLVGVALLAALSCQLWWSGRARPRITPS